MSIAELVYDGSSHFVVCITYIHHHTSLINTFMIMLWMVVHSFIYTLHHTHIHVTSSHIIVTPAHCPPRSTKMNLSGCSSAELTRTKNELDAFLGDTSLLNQVRTFKRDPALTTEQEAILACFEKTLLCYIIEDPSAVALKAKINALENELAEDRNHMALHYTNEKGERVPASSVQLRNKMRTSDNEAVRLSCLESLRSIGPFVAVKFCEIVKLRNQLAKKLGFVDFYDMKCTQAEGFSKEVLFSILDRLEVETRPIMQQALETLRADKGDGAMQPHNVNFLLSGDIAKAKDPCVTVK
jgi:hypothetical protein